MNTFARLRIGPAPGKPDSPCLKFRFTLRHGRVCIAIRAPLWTLWLAYLSLQWRGPRVTPQWATNEYSVGSSVRILDRWVWGVRRWAWGVWRRRRLGRIGRNGSSPRWRLRGLGTNESTEINRWETDCWGDSLGFSGRWVLKSYGSEVQNIYKAAEAKRPVRSP